MNANEKIEKIIKVIEEGKTVYFSTPIRIVPVNLKTLNKFRKLGYTLFKSSGDSIMMLSGKSYICMDGCKITVD